MDPDSRTSYDFDSTILFECDTPTNEDDKEIIFYDTKSAGTFELIRDKWREILGRDAEIVVRTFMETNQIFSFQKIFLKS